jgi:hypothetical protein
MATILLSIGILGAVVALLALRVLLVKDGEFRGTCASNNPYLRKETGECWACGKSDRSEMEHCEYKDRSPIGSWLERFRKSR